MAEAKKTWRKINTPSKPMQKYYGDMFVRNQNKFMRRSLLEPSHLGIEFVLEKANYKLTGAATSYEMIVESADDGSFWMIHSDFVSDAILKD